MLNKSCLAKMKIILLTSVIAKQIICGWSYENIIIVAGCSLCCCLSIHFFFVIIITPCIRYLCYKPVNIVPCIISCHLDKILQISKILIIRCIVGICLSLMKKKCSASVRSYFINCLLNSSIESTLKLANLGTSTSS